MKKKLLALFLLAFVFCYGMGLWRDCAQVTLTINTGEHSPLTVTMPRCHKQSLEFFFRELCFASNFSYTFLGSKPVSFDTYNEGFTGWDWKSIYCALRLTNLKMKRGWKIWKKYAPLFSNSRFIIWDEECPFSSSARFLVIADRKKLNAVINQHRNDFIKRLGSNCLDGESLLNQAKQRAFFKTVLNGDEYLFGIVLGYGRGNAELFSQKMHNSDIKTALFWEEEKYLEYVAHARDVHKAGEPLENIVFYPFFVADRESEESLHLRTQFLEDRKKIITYFDGKDFVEAVLSLMIEPYVDDEVHALLMLKNTDVH